MNRQSDDSTLAPPPGTAGDAPEQPSNATVGSTKGRLLAEFREQWRRGTPVLPEEVLRRWPVDPAADPDVASMLFEDYFQRRRHGEQPTPKEYEDRFPAHKDSLSSLFVQHSLRPYDRSRVERNGQAISLPGLGEELFGFRLRYELGQGAFAKVFLAQQQALAGRPVVLKISASDGEEPQTLAQLQHTHIVPIYSLHEDVKSGVRAVCMPYFGGASLSAVLEELLADPSPPTRGEQLARALASVGGPSLTGSRIEDQGSRSEDRSKPSGAIRDPRSSSLDPPWQGMDYIQATIWIGARLAEALGHAHSRGVLHRDIKPSNVLVAADGQPMLLDFNLAQSRPLPELSTTTATGGSVTTLGGTLAYRSPEHLRAWATRDPVLAAAVDERSDLYSLGLVLYEMLTGHNPWEVRMGNRERPAGKADSTLCSPQSAIEEMARERSQQVPSPRRFRQDVPWGLESIVRKCLAPEPARRYQNADQLADDLRRLLEDRPLAHAPELSWKEVGSKLARRHPRLAIALPAVLLVALLLGAGWIGWNYWDERIQAAQARLQEAQAAEGRDRSNRFDDGRLKADYLVRLAPSDWHNDPLDQGPQVCEQTLNLFHVLERPEDWRSLPEWQRLDPEDQYRLLGDMRELLVLLARARVILVQQARGKDLPPDVLQNALALLDQAEKLPGLGPSRGIWEDRASCLKALGRHEEARRAKEHAASIPLSSLLDHYLLAITFGQDQSDKAIAELDKALRINPRHFWSLVQTGILHEGRGDQTNALACFTGCLTLRPELAWSWFNRGRVRHNLGDKAGARQDYSEALARDARFIQAYVNRGLVHLDLQDHHAALKDFKEARRLGREDIVVWGGSGIALEALGQHGKAQEAFDRAGLDNARHVPMLLGYAFAVSRRLPSEADRAFKKVLDIEKDNVQALYGLALLSVKHSRTSEEGLKYFSQALAVDPGFVTARSHRAVLLAHRGDWPRAEEDITWALKTDPSGMTRYAAACVYALLVEKALDCSQPYPVAPDLPVTQWTERSLHYLREAFRMGYGRDQADDDTDLDGIRRHPEFRRLLKEERPPGNPA